MKKLKPEVLNALKAINLEKLNPKPQFIYNSIKSGKNLFIHAISDNEVSTAPMVAIFNKVNQEYEGSPRAIYITDNSQNATRCFEDYKKVCRKLDITVDLAHDKGNMIQQRNDIFDGTEIIVGNPKRIYDLYIKNGINTALLDLFIVDNLAECLKDNKQAELKRIIDSLEKKTQVVLLSNSLSNKVQNFVDNLEIQYTFLDVETSFEEEAMDND